MSQECGSKRMGPPPLLGGVPLPQFPYLISLDRGRRPHGSLEDSGIMQSAQNSVFFFFLLVRSKYSINVRKSRGCKAGFLV